VEAAISWTFYNHEKVSEEMAREILERLRYPNVIIDEVCLLVREHMFHYTPDWSDAAVRRFVRRARLENLEALFALRRADAFGTSGEEHPPIRLAEFRARIERVMEKGAAMGLRDLAVDGRDLMEAGIPVGPRLGIILKELLETVTDDPEENTKEKLLALAIRLNLRYTEA
jgi:hypothetical protein